MRALRCTLRLIKVMHGEGHRNLKIVGNANVHACTTYVLSMVYNGGILFHKEYVLVQITLPQ